jgi:hypothetical protein
MNTLLNKLVFGVVALTIFFLLILNFGFDFSHRYSRVFGDLAILAIGLLSEASWLASGRKRRQGRTEGKEGVLFGRGRLLSIGACSILILLTALDIFLGVDNTHHRMFIGLAVLTMILIVLLHHCHRIRWNKGPE